MAAKMKLSCLPVSLFGEIANGEITIQDWAKYAKKIGLNGFDISIMFIKNHTPVYLRQLREELDKVGIPLVMACTYPDLVHPNPLQRERELDYLRRDIAVCSQLSVKYLRVLAGQNHPQLARQQGIEFAVSGLRAASIIADRYNIQLVYEDHAKPGAWDYIDFSFDPEIFLEIVDGIKDTSIGINFDTANIIAAGWQIMPVLEKVFDKIKTIHISDTSAFGVFDPVLIGTGVTPLQEVFRYLKQHNFDGWYCIEEASNSGFAGICQAVKNVRMLWEQA